MEIEESIQKLREKLDHSHSSTPSTSLYADQVIAKFKNVRYSLYKLHELEQPIVVSSSTQSPDLLDDVEKVNERVNFYCECFLDFLRSSIDILAQLINQLTPHKLPETSVDIKKVAAIIDPTSQPHLKTSVDYLINLTAFKTLEKYRHCSMHRRQVYIYTTRQRTEAAGTIGYPYLDASTSQQPAYNSYICTNPSDLDPVVDYSQTAATFCESLLKILEKRMVTIVNRAA